MLHLELSTVISIYYDGYGPSNKDVGLISSNILLTLMVVEVLCLDVTARLARKALPLFVDDLTLG